MEVKINKEIREFHENIFFGLTLRQFIFSVFACIVAVGLYFLLKPYLGMETLSWLCILGAVPFALLGFVKFNGMTAEQFLWCLIKYQILYPSHFEFATDNFYYLMFKPLIDKNLKRDFFNNKRVHKDKKKIIKTKYRLHKKNTDSKDKVKE